MPGPCTSSRALCVEAISPFGQSIGIGYWPSAPERSDPSRRAPAGGAGREKNPMPIDLALSSKKRRPVLPRGPGGPDPVPGPASERRFDWVTDRVS